MEYNDHVHNDERTGLLGLGLGVAEDQVRLGPGPGLASSV